MFYVQLKIARKKIGDFKNSSNGLFKPTNRFWLAVDGLKSVLALSVERWALSADYGCNQLFLPNEKLTASKGPLYPHIKFPVKFLLVVFTLKSSPEKPSDKSSCFISL